MIVSLVSISPPFYAPWKSKAIVLEKSVSPVKRGSFGVKAFFFNPPDEPILKEALKEPVAFLGGVFAGLLRLDLNEDPLKEWVTRTVEASGLTKEEIDAEAAVEQEVPQQIEIE